MSGAPAFAAAARIAASTGSWPPSELASEAMPRTRAASTPGIGRVAATASSFRVSVPVLSAQRTSMLAASSTADRRVGRTSTRARSRAPTAAARVNVAGRATGIDARTVVRIRGTISADGRWTACAYATIATRRVPLNRARLRTTRRTAFCWVLSAWAVRTSSAARPNFVRGPVAVTSATASPRLTNAPA
jgi:hypothetical protein